MTNRYIDEIHKIREDNFEATKNLSFDEKQKKIQQGAMDFLKLIENIKTESADILQ